MEFNEEIKLLASKSESIVPTIQTEEEIEAYYIIRCMLAHWYHSFRTCSIS